MKPCSKKVVLFVHFLHEFVATQLCRLLRLSLSPLISLEIVVCKPCKVQITVCTFELDSFMLYLSLQIKYFIFYMCTFGFILRSMLFTTSLELNSKTRLLTHVDILSQSKLMFLLVSHLISVLFLSSATYAFTS